MSCPRYRYYYQPGYLVTERLSEGGGWVTVCVVIGSEADQCWESIQRGDP